MIDRRHPALALAVLIGFSGIAPAQEGAEHPTLVRVETASCKSCHEDILADRSVLHVPAVDDCTTCHEMVSDEAGTRVTLTDAEPSLCLMCHDDLSTYVAAEVEAPHYPVTESCLICHDPHGGNEKKLIVAAPAELCGTCHDPEDLAAPHGEQLTPATDCTTCHEPHGSQRPVMLAADHLHAPFAEGSCSACHRKPFGSRIRLRLRGERLCEACHGSMTEDGTAGGSRHAALEGERTRAGCLACHDPHMADTSGLLVASGPDLCATCHVEVVEAARDDTGHYPAADDCLTCHKPHASEQSRLLESPAGELCRACHPTDDAELAERHLGAELQDLDCGSCHTPHGSGQEHLLAANVHAPLLDGCDTCHEGDFDELAEDGESALCLMCHDDVGESAQQSVVPHAALEVARCADCHNPHASAQDHLVAAAGGDVCTACHDDIAPGEGESAHAVIDLLGCQACHEPHGGDRERLLRGEVNELCLECHDSARVDRVDGDVPVVVLSRFEVSAATAAAMATLSLSDDGEHGHPLGNHRVLGSPSEDEIKNRNTETDFTGELGCLTCHDPHKGASPKILRWNATSGSEVCLQCHGTK